MFVIFFVNTNANISKETEVITSLKLLSCVNVRAFVLLAFIYDHVLLYLFKNSYEHLWRTRCWVWLHFLNPPERLVVWLMVVKKGWPEFQCVIEMTSKNHKTQPILERKEPHEKYLHQTVEGMRIFPRGQWAVLAARATWYKTFTTKQIMTTDVQFSNWDLIQRMFISAVLLTEKEWWLNFSEVYFLGPNLISARTTTNKQHLQILNITAQKSLSSVYQ